MEDEEIQKMQYINENIIEKGYNQEEVANFTMKTLGLPFETLSLEKLKQVVEDFKDRGLTDTYKTIKLNEKKAEKRMRRKKRKKKEKKKRKRKKRKRKRRKKKRKKKRNLKKKNKKLITKLLYILQMNMNLKLVINKKIN